MPQTSRTRYKQLLERKRQARRRVTLRRLAAGVLLVVVVGVVTIAVASIRGCAEQRAQLKARKPLTIPVDPQQSKIDVVFAHDFRPGPTFVAIDSERVYIGQPSVARDKAPTTQLAAFDINGNEPLWQVQSETPLLQLGVAGGNIIGVPEDGGPLQRYAGVTGKPLDATENSTLEAQVQTDGSMVITAATTHNEAGALTARLNGYVPSTGKTWTLRPKLAGLTSGIDACCGAQARVELSCWEALCAYKLHNVLGMVDTARGRMKRNEYAAGGHIAALTVDRSEAGKAAYIVSGDPEDATLYRLVRIPLDPDLPARRVHEFRSGSGDFLIYGDAGNVLLAYRDVEGQAKLACFRKDSSKPALTIDTDAGVTDMSAIRGAAGEYLVATNQRFTDGEAAGRSRLLRVRLRVPDVVQVARYGRPVSWIVPFKRDCLALLRGGGLAGGGQVLRYNADNGRLKLLRRAKYELLEPLHSADDKALLVTSYPASYLRGEGGPLQALVFK